MRGLVNIYGCPICGYEPEVRYNEQRGLYAIFCVNPVCSDTCSDWYADLDDAIYDWNNDVCGGVDINEG